MRLTFRNISTCTSSGKTRYKTNCCTVKPDTLRPSADCCSGNSNNNANQDKPPCCGPATVLNGGLINENVPGFTGWLETATGPIAQNSTALTWTDHLGACKVRWGIGRMGYIVPPGLYAIGTPDADAAVVVTANYKMSYDLVRNSLAGRNVWLLVLETNGVNVWCAAGKGTFGTDELVSRINMAGLHNAVTHRQLILPILGAPGIAAHEVAKKTGFTIRYATIRVNDLPEYLENGMNTTTAMRQLTFNTYERVVLIPIELSSNLKKITLCGGALFLAGLLAEGAKTGTVLLTAYLGAALSGLAIVPLLLPWIPGRSFAFKGALTGLIWICCFYLLAENSNLIPSAWLAIFIALPAISAYHALNFTGCTVYTSRSGVKKEMRLAIPLMGAAATIGIVLLITGLIC
ncbi:MAG TPA: mercury methylation corrinoid protein HgcA [Deltaproteobacteria bacterium]|nr:mercury methylation corrinoid protein HgcA [Deltaproteobacteria bacterium]